MPANFFLSDAAKETNVEPRLSLSVVAQLDSLSVSTATPSSITTAFDSDADMVSSCGSSDGSYIVSPSGRTQRLSKYVKDEDEKTTLMVRNIPQGMSQNEMLEKLEEVVPGVNFLYLPVSRRRQGNVGYAFVNFINGDKAEECLREFQNTKLSGHKSSKTLDIGFAQLQGFKQNVRFYRRSKVCRSKNRPFMKF
jgi:hypothetical protein